MDIFNEFKAGSHRALARLITMVEDFDPEGFDILSRLEDAAGGASSGRAGARQIIVGITGPPGSGKSSLVDRLARSLICDDAWRGACGSASPGAPCGSASPGAPCGSASPGAPCGSASSGVPSGPPSVAVIAFDPSSPFTGGAILGDRVRMANFVSPHLFFRSMGTRGSLGGMSRCVPYVLRIYELFGFDYIIVETVGVGQLEIDVVKMTDTTIVTEVPGLGDEIQAIKAGIFEIGDIFVINKTDRPGVDKVFCEINYMLNLRRDRLVQAGERPSWEVPVVKTNCVTGEGIQDLLEKIAAHRDSLYSDGRIYSNRRARLREQYLSFIRNLAADAASDALASDEGFAALLDRGIPDFYSREARAILASVMNKALAGLWPEGR